LRETLREQKAFYEQTKGSFSILYKVLYFVLGLSLVSLPYLLYNFIADDSFPRTDLDLQLKSLFGETLMKDFLVDLNLLAYETQSEQTRFYTKATEIDIKDAVGATMSSPVYFDMKHIVTDGDLVSKNVKMEILVDASFVQNDLSLVSLIDAKITHPNKKLRIVSLAAGEPLLFDRYKGHDKHQRLLIATKRQNSQH